MQSQPRLRRCRTSPWTTNPSPSSGRRERAVGPAVHGFLDTIGDRQPETPLLLASPIHATLAEGPSAAVPTRVNLSRLTMARVRAILEEIVALRWELGDAHLHFLDGRALLGHADAGESPDDIHPNDVGYGLMADRFTALAFGPGGPFAETASAAGLTGPV